MNKYKSAMDTICDNEFAVTGAEMLGIAKSASLQGEIDTVKGVHRGRAAGKVLWIAAACMLVFGTTVSAMGYGPFGEGFRRFFGNDPVTASIIEEGHYGQIGQSVTDGIFTVDFISVTGDAMYPKLLFDVTVNDEALTSTNSRLRLFAYVMDEDTYRDRRDQYVMWNAYGQKDPDVASLYHVCMDGPGYFLTKDGEVLASIEKISFEFPGYEEIYEYDVDMEYRFSVPDSALKETYIQYYDNMTIPGFHTDYDLYRAEFGAYDSVLVVTYDYIGTELADGRTDFEEVRNLFDSSWQDFSGHFVLSVDGEEYAPLESGWSWCDEEGTFFEPGRCSAWIRFPSIDHGSAESIKLIAGGQEYVLKQEIQ